MKRKLFTLILLANVLSFSLMAQKTEVIKEPQRILNDAKALFNQKKYAAAYQQYVNYIDLQKDNNASDLSDAYYYKSISALNLENNDADKQIREYIVYFLIVQGRIMLFSILQTSIKSRITSPMQ